MLVVPFFFLKEVQFNILSGQAGDVVPCAAGTIELSAAGRAPHPLFNNHTHTEHRDTGIAVYQTYTQTRILDVIIWRVSS